jgi:uncharacterized protein DUF6594
LHQIPNPQCCDIKAICDWLNGQHSGAAFLAGDVEDVWNIQLANGRVSPAGVEDFYGFTEYDGLAFRTGLLFASIFRLVCRSFNSTQPHHIDTTTSGGLGQAVMTVIASVFPVIPIVAFYFVKKLIVRISLIIVFTAVFAAIMVVGMGLKTDKTLAITTAQVNSSGLLSKADLFPL